MQQRTKVVSLQDKICTGLQSGYNIINLQVTSYTVRILL